MDEIFGNLKNVFLLTIQGNFFHWFFMKLVTSAVVMACIYGIGVCIEPYLVNMYGISIMETLTYLIFCMWMYHTKLK